jgi:hypothetical protein
MCVCVSKKAKAYIPYIKSGLLYFCGGSLDSIYWRSHPERIKKEAMGEKEEEEEMSLLCAGHLYIVWILAHLCVLLCALYIYMFVMSQNVNCRFSWES